MADPRPVIITSGEPAGIGPEIAALSFEALGADVPMAWIGDPSHLPPGTDFALIDDLSQVRSGTALPVLARDFGAPRTPGQPNPVHAQGVVDVIAEAVALCTSGAASGLCTGPIHKAALMDGADFAYPGHTEYLAALAGDVPVVMMLACPELRVVPVTIHIPLAKVPEQLNAAILTDTILITHAGLRQRFGLERPRIAVSGLNPHAGEDGKMGSEDQDIIAPVIDALRDKGMAITGPHSADTLFHAAARAHYDVAICMYHDQALIPIKTLDFAGGVNVTLGLPFVRTSPDHGTAFDIAGKGKADPTSMIAAIKMAAQMAERHAG